MTSKKQPCPSQKSCPSVKQLTLFACLSSPGSEDGASDGGILKRLQCIRADPTDSDLESDLMEFERSSSPLSHTNSVSDEDSTINSLPSTSSGPSGHQQNYVTVEKPSGSTTVIINSQSQIPKSVSLTANEVAASTQALSVPDIAQGVHQSPVRPVLRFPTTLFGDKSRSFNSEWYKRYQWLEYSVCHDAAYCYCCCQFSAPASSRAEEAFTCVGYRDWKHGTGKQGVLEKHNNCRTHKLAMFSWCEYMKNKEKATSVADRLDTARNLQIQENRQYLRTVAEVILLCAKQDLALRGHRESQSSLNRGNFLEILHLIARHDQVVQKRLQYGPRNAICTSPGIQNSMLNILGSMVRRLICSAIKESLYFSILADETKDCSRQEQLAIVLRYIDNHAIIHERFLTYVAVSSLTAESLTKYILDTLKEFQLDLRYIVSQGYDGASVMSGKCSGVQERIKEVVPQAIYIHCYAHTLNLVLVDCVKNILLAGEFFCLLESLYVFLSSTKAHTIFMEKQCELHPGKQPLQLQRLCDTRWACRYGAVNALCCTYDCILATLEDICHGTDLAKAVEAKGFWHQVKSFSFIITLVTFDRVLSSTKALSDQLQSMQVDLSSASELVLATKSTVEDYRSDTMWNKVYNYSQSIADLHGIQVMSASSTRHRRPPKRFDECMLLESTGSREHLSSSEEYKQFLYFPVLDTFLAEFSRRFDEKNISIMQAIQACSPRSRKFLHPSTLQPLVDTYGLSQETIEMESRLAKHMLEKKDLDCISDVLLTLTPLKEAFPELIKLVKIAMTIAVPTAQCERTFSSLKRIKTYLRSTMGEQRLTDLAILSVERELANTLKLDDAVMEFAGTDKNRRILLL